MTKMKTYIKLLDCTLRDGAYVNNSIFGAPCIQGIIKKSQKANIDVIEGRDLIEADGSSVPKVTELPLARNS